MNEAVLSQIMSELRSKDRSERSKRLLSKAISCLENEDLLAGRVLKELFPFVGRAYRIGFTGPPGSGKSTLVNLISKVYADQGRRVGIIAVDPTSSFTGGAILGDRYRMNDIVLHPNIFIRSMASRGSFGGLVKTAYQVADVMDAFGMDIILFETVGVGQSEVEIVEHADTTVVVLVPESGDGVQAMKAGVMEIADVFVINKSDREQADHIRREIEAMLELKSYGNKKWIPKVIKSVATQRIGIESIVKELEAHRTEIENSGEYERRRKKRIHRELVRLVEEKIRKQWKEGEVAAQVASHVAEIYSNKNSIYTVAESLHRDFFDKRS